MAQQTLRAIEEADRVLFLVDAREGSPRPITSSHRRCASSASTSSSSLNKAEGLDAATAAADFHQLGLGEPQAISATHGDGVRSLMETCLEGLGARRSRAMVPGPTTFASP